MLDETIEATEAPTVARDEIESGRRWNATKLSPKAVGFVVEECLENIRVDGTCDEVSLYVSGERHDGGWRIEVSAVAATVSPLAVSMEVVGDE